MAIFILHLPSEMRDHLIAKDFKNCTLMEEYSNLLYSSRASCAVAATITDYEAAISAVSGDSRHQEFSLRNQRPTLPELSGRGSNKTPCPHQDDSEVCFYHNTYGNKSRKCKLGGGMIFLQDDESKQQFLVDTSVAVSVLSHHSPSRKIMTPPRAFSS
jgi:hypothetical protein